MKLQVVDGCIKAGQFFRLIATGYAIGIVVILGPLFLLSAVGIWVDGTQGHRWWTPLLIPVMVPVIAILQGILFGGLIVLGLKVYTKSSRRIEVEVG